MKKILHIFSSFEIGGVQRRFKALCDLQTQMGQDDKFQHTVISLDGNWQTKPLLSGLDFIRYQSAPTPHGHLLTRLKNIRRFLSENPHDLMMAYNWGSVEWMLANRFFPLIKTIHVQDGYSAEESRNELYKRTVIRRFAYAPAPVVVPSQSLLGRINTLWRIPQAHQHYIPNGVDLMRFSGQTNLTRADLHIPDTPIIIGTVAGLRAEKNITRLINAFHQILQKTPDIHLLILGDGPEEQQLKAYVQKLDLNKKVTFAGSQDKPEDFIPLMNIFALSSDTEQMPLTVIEAMACSKPIVATDVGDIKSMVAAENIPYITGNNAEKLAQSLIALATNLEMRRSIGCDNEKKAQTDFSDTAMYQAWANLYETAGK